MIAAIYILALAVVLLTAGFAYVVARVNRLETLVREMETK